LILALKVDTSLLEDDETLATSLIEAEEKLVTAKFATVRRENADDVAMLALWTTMLIVVDADPCADLIPFEADIDACCSCWEKVAFKAMMVLEISTVALSTDAMMRFEQSWGLF
jgi:hypothetical protein